MAKPATQTKAKIKKAAGPAKVAPSQDIHMIPLDLLEISPLNARKVPESPADDADVMVPLISGRSF